MQYLIHFLLIRKSRIISHTRKVNSTFILHILYKSEQNVDSREVAEVENLQYYILRSEEADTKPQRGQTTRPNCIRFQSSVRLSEVRLG